MADCPKCKSPISEDAYFCAECGEPLKASPYADADGPMMTVGGLETLADMPTTGPSERAFPVLEPGTRFAERYEIAELIGRGGMGLVYRAKDQLTQTEIALKLIRPERLTGTNAVERLIAEGLIARDIRHPNIVAVYDIGEADGYPFVSMEYIGGKSLRAWHRELVQARQDVPVRIAARIVAEVLDGLKAAHAAGVIHRDLKPENIILVGEPTEKAAPLKILDFGIARATGNSLESGTGTGLGTPRYMAPEQITNASTAGPSADLYSLSVIFYELLVDVLPQGHWQPPSGGRSDVPQGIDKLIETGLSNRPANRPQTAADYRMGLVNAVNLTSVVNNKKGKTGQLDTDGRSTNSALKWVGIGTAAILGLAVIGAIIPDEDIGSGDPCDGLFGPDLNECRGIISDYRNEDDDDPVPFSPPPPPPPPVMALSGSWNDGLGTTYTMQVNRKGQFSGTGYAIDGTPLRLSGSFAGTSGQYVVEAPSVGIALNGFLEWDRGCHINFRTMDPTGQNVLEQGQMHVNHAPGAPCPS